MSVPAFTPAALAHAANLLHLHSACKHYAADHDVAVAKALGYPDRAPATLLRHIDGLRMALAKAEGAYWGYAEASRLRTGLHWTRDASSQLVRAHAEFVEQWFDAHHAFAHGGEPPTPQQMQKLQALWDWLHAT